MMFDVHWLSYRQSAEYTNATYLLTSGMRDSDWDVCMTKLFPRTSHVKWLCQL